jgi:hypothetical protein
MISEEAIDRQIERLISDQDRIQIISDFAEWEPDIAAYLASPHFDILTDLEKDYFLFVALVIWKVFESPGRSKLIHLEDLFSHEEKNWTLMDDSGSDKNQFDVFFRDYPETEILAFIEDSVQPEGEDAVVTLEGQLHMFVGLKSIADAFLASEPDTGNKLRS